MVRSLILFSAITGMVAAQDSAVFKGEIEVSRIITEVRVVDRAGSPVLGRTYLVPKASGTTVSRLGE